VRELVPSRNWRSHLLATIPHGFEPLPDQLLFTSGWAGAKLPVNGCDTAGHENPTAPKILAAKPTEIQIHEHQLTEMDPPRVAMGRDVLRE
jgi:hypothetical protein